jgi:hypothetical protein
MKRGGSSVRSYKKDETHAFEQARGGSGACYAMELTELLRRVAHALNVD